MIFVSYLCLWSFIQTAQCHLIPIPLEDPHPINSHELMCHYGLPPSGGSGASTYKFSAKTPSPTSHEVEGYICSKTLWETVCDEGFFGGQTVSYTIHKMPISDVECMTSYKEMLSGSVQADPHFPPNYCFWMSVNSKSETYITMKLHKVMRDPYSDNYIDLLFLNHKCSQSICPTHYDNVKWVAETPKGKACTEWYMVKGTFSIDPSRNMDWSYVETEFIPKTPLSKVCYGVHYCGTKGYATDKGLFFAPLTNQGNVFDFERDLPVKACSPDKEVSLLPLSSSLAAAELSTLEILFNTKCNDVVSKIKEGGNLTVYELGFLNPTHPGIGAAFIDIKGKLFSAKARFEPISSYQINFTKDLTIRYVTKGNQYQDLNVTNCTWSTLSNGSTLCRWYNGIMITKDQVIPSYSALYEEDLEVGIYQEIQPNFDKHIGLPDIDNETINTSDQVTDPDYRNSDIIGSVEGWFVRWFHYLGAAITFVLILVGLYCICPYCISCVRCCYLLKPKTDPQSVPYNVGSD